MKPGRPCRERAIPRLARTKRNLGLLALRELDIRPLFQALRVDASLLDRLVPPHSLQRLRGAETQHLDVLVIVCREFAGRVEVDLKEPDHLAVSGDRKDEARLVGLPRPGIRPGVIFRRPARGRLDDDGRQALQRLVERRISPHSSISHDSRSSVYPTARAPVRCRRSSDSRKNTPEAARKPMQRLVNGGGDNVGRSAGVAECRIGLGKAVGLHGCGFGGHAKRSLAPDRLQNASRDERRNRTDGKEHREEKRLGNRRKSCARKHLFFKCRRACSGGWSQYTGVWESRSRGVKRVEESRKSPVQSRVRDGGTDGRV